MKQWYGFPDYNSKAQSASFVIDAAITETWICNFGGPWAKWAWWGPLLRAFYFRLSQWEEVPGVGGIHWWS